MAENKKPALRVPLGLVVAGLLFGTGLRAGQAYALDGGEGRCLTQVRGEFVEARRLEGVGALEPDPFWRAHAILEFSLPPPDTIYSLAIFDDYVRSEDDKLSLEPEPAP